MSFLEPVWAVAENTLREAIRSRVLYALLFFAVLLIGAGVILGDLSYADSERLLQTIGLAAIRIFATATAIAMGVGLIFKEIERRTVFTILTKPVARWQFLLGKYLGLLATVWIQVCLMGVAFAAGSFLIEAPFGLTYVVELLLLMVELALVVALATFFSSFSTPILPSLFTTGFVMAGHMSRDLRDLGARSQSEAVQDVTALLYRVLPDMGSFDFSIIAVHGLPYEATQVWLPLLYGFAYAGLLLLVAACILDRRDFL